MSSSTGRRRSAAQRGQSVVAMQVPRTEDAGSLRSPSVGKLTRLDASAVATRTMPASIAASFRCAMAIAAAPSSSVSTQFVCGELCLSSPSTPTGSTSSIGF